MDAEKGCKEPCRRSGTRLPWSRLIATIVALVVVISIGNFCLTTVLWIEVKDLRQYPSHGEAAKASGSENGAMRGVSGNKVEDFNVQDNFTAWLDKHHQSGRYSLPAPIEGLLAEHHKRFRRSTNACSTKGCDCSKKLDPRSARRCRRCCWETKTRDKLNRLTKEVESLKAKITPTGSTSRTKYEDRLGQFEGGHDPNNQGCRNVVAGNYLKTTVDGTICMWRYASWMTDSAKQLYQLDKHDGRVKVTQAGMYFIYGQLVVNDVGPRVAQGLWVLTNGQKREVARCVESAKLQTIGSTTVSAFRTCFFGTMVRLENDSSVYLGLITLQEQVQILHTQTTAFFGLIQFSDDKS